MYGVFKHIITFSAMSVCVEDRQAALFFETAGFSCQYPRGVFIYSDSGSASEELVEASGGPHSKISGVVLPSDISSSPSGF